MKRLSLLLIAIIALIGISILSIEVFTRSQNELMAQPKIQLPNILPPNPIQHPHQIQPVSGMNQLGYPGEPLRMPLVIQTSRAKIGQTVTFAISEGSGSVNPTHPVVDNSGRATAYFTLGTSSVGRQRVKVSTSGSKDVFFQAYPRRPVSHYNVLGLGSGSDAKVYRKFTGELEDSGVPSIIDYSYAGYKHGEEAIPTVRLGDYTMFNVDAYGAIPDDGQSDSQAIRDAFNAANRHTGKALVRFSSGQYDVFMAGESNRSFAINSSNVVVKGAGAQGVGFGGTTIKMHQQTLDQYHYLITAGGGYVGGGPQVNGDFTSGSMYFDVVNGSELSGAKHVYLAANIPPGDPEWWNHSTRSANSYDDEWVAKRQGLDIYEFHQVDRIEGNRVYLKSPLIATISSRFAAKKAILHQNVGIEDLHIDGSFTAKFDHDVWSHKSGRHAISLSWCANSWIRRCTTSNVTEAFAMKRCYASTIVACHMYGNAGHYGVQIGHSTYCLALMTEDFTNRGTDHGANVHDHAAGNVYVFVGGTSAPGPDCHSVKCRYTLFDSCVFQDHHTNGGGDEARPHHLDGYIRWNNYINNGGDFDLWRGICRITQGIFVGFNQVGSTDLKNIAWQEKNNTWANPNSLYFAQLTHRLGYEPAWIRDAKIMYSDFFRNMLSFTNLNAITFHNSVSEFEYTSDIPKDTDITGELRVHNITGGRPTFNLLNHQDKFEIHSGRGIITAKKNLPYVANQHYSLLVMVADTVGTDAMIVIVKFVTGDDIFVEESVNVKFTDHIPAGTQIGSALEVHEGNEGMTYSLTNYNDDFQIDASTGIITAKRKIRFILKRVGGADNVMALNVRGVNGGNQEDITVNVKFEGPAFDIEDTSAENYTISENNSIGDVVGTPPKLVNPGSGLKFLLLRQFDHASFTLDRQTGKLTANEVFDYETKNTYQIRIRVLDSSDGYSIYKFGTFTVRILDVYEGEHSNAFVPLDQRTPQVAAAIRAELNGKNLGDIKTLKINGKNITSLKRGDFSGMPNLTTLILNHNNITEIPNGIFYGLNNLKALYLRNNLIETLHSDSFAGTPNLWSVYLEFNRISRIGRDVFKHSPNLRELRLSDNQIEHIDPLALNNNRALQILLMDRILDVNFASYASQNPAPTGMSYRRNTNRIYKLPRELFLNLPKLQRLSLRGNKPVVKRPDNTLDISCLSRLHNLKILYIDDCHIDNIDVVYYMPGLTTLTAGNNSISDISNFTRLGKLSYLYIVNNYIQDVSPLRNLDRLGMLFIADNPLNPNANAILAAMQDANSMYIDIDVTATAPEVEEVVEVEAPAKTELLANYPNPFNPETWIPYQLSKPAHVSLTIYNMRGVVVREITLGHQVAGLYNNRARAIHWDGKNNIGERVASGLYFYTLKAGDYTATRKMLIRK